MKHNCLKATKICLWRRDDFDGCVDKKKKWCICPMEPSWYIVCGWAWYELKNGDEIDINKNCQIDMSGRIIIRDDMFLLVDYDGEDVRIKINKL